MIVKRLGILLLVLMSLVACKPNDTDVKLAAQERWEALISGDLQRAYQFYAHALKKSTTLEKFKKQVRGVGLWKQAEVINADCEKKSDQCFVDIKVTVSMSMQGLVKPVETSDTIRELWVQEGWLNDWRYMDTNNH